MKQLPEAPAQGPRREDGDSGTPETGKRRLSPLKLAIVVSVVAVSLLLVLTALRPVEVHIYNTSIRSNLNKVQWFSTKQTTTLDRPGPITLNVTGQVDGYVLSEVGLITRRANESKPKKQPYCCEVAEKNFYGFVQLGTPKLPVVDDEEYWFQVITNDDMGKPVVLAQGSIDINETVISKASNAWILAGLGILATLLQIVEQLQGFVRQKDENT